MYILYAFPYSQHARRIVSLFEEADLPYELAHVAMDQGEHMSNDYLRINPNHQVPTLVDGDFTLYESNAILRYLCNKHQLIQWYPVDAATRAVVDQWLDWNQCRLAPAVVDIVLNSLFLGKDGDSTAIERGRQQLKELAPILDLALANKRFLAGDAPTIADLSVASNIFQLTMAEETLHQANLQRWYGEVAELPGFQKSLPQG